MSRIKEISFTLQKKNHIFKTDDISPETSLLQYLRSIKHLNGTKYMCLEGNCGSCIVAVTFKHPITEKSITISVNSCLVSIYSCYGWNIHTIDGIGNKKDGYHPLQKTLAKFNGTQCGYCSPGMVMNMYPLYEAGDKTEKEIEDAFGGNICRCTGYRSILSAFKSFSKEKIIPPFDNSFDIEDFNECLLSKRNCIEKCSFSCNKLLNSSSTTKNSAWYKANSINEIIDIFKQNRSKTYRLVAGNTAQGVYPSITKPDLYIDVTSVKSLLSESLNTNQLTIGANKTLNDTITLFTNTAKSVPQFSYLQKLADHIMKIAHTSVRNIGTLAGNLAMKYEHNEFPSDIFVILEAVNATVTIVNLNRSEREYSISDYLNLNMKHKIIKNITLTGLNNTYKYMGYKIMPCAQNAHAIVNAAFLLQLTNFGKVQSASIVYGGINPSFIHAVNTEKLLIGKSLFNNRTLQESFNSLNNELNPNVMPPDPSPVYRKNLAISLFYKYILSIAPDNLISQKNKSGGSVLQRPVSTGTQDFQTNESLYPVNKPIPKIEALLQTSGELEYVIDIPYEHGELFASFVVAQAAANSIIESVDTSPALGVDGVIVYYDKNDIPGRNTFFPKEANYPPGFLHSNFIEEELFCEGTVKYYNQPVGIIIAKTQHLADEAALLVKITYNNRQKKPLLTITEILMANDTNKIVNETIQNATSKGNDVKQVLKGSFQTSAQYHYHMETQVCFVVPRDDFIEVYPSSQWKDLVQLAIAKLLNIKENRINVYVKHIGGAFGAKITRNSMLSCAAALAAWKLQVPIRMRLSYVDNMNIIGKRYPSYGEYEVGVNNIGEIQYLNYTYYMDYGIVGNELIAKGTMDIFSSSYKSDTFTLSCNSTRTDNTASTYMRAPGHTTTMAAIESIMEHIAMQLDISPLDVRIKNMEIPKNEKLIRFIDDLTKYSNFEQRQSEITVFNKNNRWRKKGLALVPMTYPYEIAGSYTSVVAIYSGDGSVAITHGGIEMGQGVNTKAAQVCAYTLGIPMGMVDVKRSSNITTPNDWASARSTTSDGISLATQKACEILLERIKPVRDKMNNPTWSELIKQCQDESVDLIADNLYSPNEAKNYDIYGVCAAEVEIDILTGVHQINRVDLLEDTGTSISPCVDIGQIEGAFVMGIGFWTTEELVYNADGELLTNRTSNYKVPGALDIPIDFRVKMPKNNPNPVGVLGSKASGEPPLCLAVSIPLAIRHAVASARRDADPTVNQWYMINGPSTVENTFMNSLNSYKQYTL